MNQLMDSVTSQAVTFAALSTRTNSGGGGEKTEKKKTWPGLHIFTQCKQEVYHKEGNCLELAANKSKRYAGWTGVLE